MRNVVILLVLTALFGCDGYYFNPQGFNQGLMNAYMLDQYGRQNEGNVVYPSPNYWQEQRAKQEYLDNQFSFPNPH